MKKTNLCSRMNLMQKSSDQLSNSIEEFTILESIRFFLNTLEPVSFFWPIRNRASNGNRIRDATALYIIWLPGLKGSVYTCLFSTNKQENYLIRSNYESLIFYFIISLDMPFYSQYNNKLKLNFPMKTGRPWFTWINCNSVIKNCICTLSC